MTFIDILTNMSKPPLKKTETRQNVNTADIVHSSTFSDAGFLKEYENLWLGHNRIIPEYFAESVYADVMLRFFFRLLLKKLVQEKESFRLLKGFNIYLKEVEEQPIPTPLIIRSINPMSLLRIIVEELEKTSIEEVGFVYIDGA